MKSVSSPTTGSTQCNCVGQGECEFCRTPYTRKLTPENQTEWEADLDLIGFQDGFKDRLSQCVDNMEEFAGLTAREALQQGWYDYADG